MCEHFSHNVGAHTAIDFLEAVRPSEQPGPRPRQLGSSKHTVSPSPLVGHVRSDAQGGRKCGVDSWQSFLHGEQSPAQSRWPPSEFMSTAFSCSYHMAVLPVFGLIRTPRSSCVRIFHCQPFARETISQGYLRLRSLPLKERELLII